VKSVEETRHNFPGKKARSVHSNELIIIPRKFPRHRHVYPCSIRNKLPTHIRAAHLNSCSSESN